MKDYQATIGIECHVQLRTKTKLFARVNNDAREAEPNTTVSEICFGLPGVLPYLNQEAVQLAIRAGMALNAKINPVSKFDRKHYFYPDLPKGYQITQYDQPIIGEGKLSFPVGEKTVEVRIERAHLEEDAGKLTHPDGADFSLVDLNRAGTPLLEIVSYPDMHTPQEAKAYARELYLAMLYADVSDVDLYHGHMRFDVNISVAPVGSETLGTRAEVKNLNSFRAVEKAAAYEFDRQVALLEKGESVKQETRGWDDNKQITFAQRSKEEAQDYRYFPDPDLPPVSIGEDTIAAELAVSPKHPQHYREVFAKLGLKPNQIEMIIGDNLLAPEFEAVAGKVDIDHSRRISNWLVGDIPRIKRKDGNKDKITLSLVAPKLLLPKLVTLSEMVAQSELSSNGAVSVLEELVFNQNAEPRTVATERNLLQVSDEAEIEKIVSQVISDNPKAAADVKNGELKAVGFLTGQVMKASQGQANPALAQKIIKKQLGVS